MWRGRTAELSRSASWPSVGGLFAFGKTPEVAKPIEPKPEPIREPEPAPQQNFVQQVQSYAEDSARRAEAYRRMHMCKMTPILHMNFLAGGSVFSSLFGSRRAEPTLQPSVEDIAFG
jgi:hypothetical protein